MRPLLITASHPALSDAFEHCIATITGGTAHEHARVTFESAEELADKLESVGARRLRDTMVVALLGPSIEVEWQYGAPGEARLGLAVRLMLGFPETFFVFLGGQVADTPHRQPLNARAIRHVRHWRRRHESGYRSIFDESGGRSALKQKVLSNLGLHLERHALWQEFAGRPGSVVAADEEQSFVYLNGYIAYKFGYRVHLASSRAELVEASAHTPFDVALLDYDLRYPDEDAKLHDGEFDTQQLRELVGEAAGFTLEVTAGRKTGRYATCHKPYPGMHHLTRVAREQNPLRRPFEALLGSLDTPAVSPLRTFATSVYRAARRWLRYRDDERPARPPGLHSAPYKVLEIAEQLLARARALIAPDGLDTADWIHAALLAGEAKELLSGLSRTRAFEALAIQYEAELEAEISFLGMSQAFDISARLDDLAAEALLIEGVQKNAAERPLSQVVLHFMVQVTNNMRRRLVERQQVEAAEQCLRRYAHYSVRRRGETRWSPLASVMRCAVAYVDRVTQVGTSATSLLFWNVIWILGFAVAFSALLLTAGTEQGRAIPWAIEHSLFTFVQFQPASTTVHDIFTKRNDWLELTYQFILFFELAIAYVHLGLLIAVLDRKISRRAP